jgi:uncharacterized membrane protein YhaH (DUF805 family)
MDWYLRVIRKYADFNGRARRQEFWMFALFNFIIGIVLEALALITGSGGSFSPMWILSGLYGLFVLIPGLAVSVRRLHDGGHTGWWWLINLVPFGFIVFLVFAVQDSQPGDNKYGPNPKMTVNPA